MRISEVQNDLIKIEGVNFMKKNRIILVGIIILIGVISFMFYFSQGLKRRYESEVKEGIEKYKVENTALLTEDDMKGLPEPVKNYIRHVGAVGKPKIWNVRAEFDGKMKQDENKGWMQTYVTQYNFFENPVRMFYIYARMFGIPVYGLHAYKEEKGTMLIKAAGIVPVVNSKGSEMNASDTVTLFNDMCMFAPASLIDNRISWETVDARKVKATFENGPNKISAELFFNDKSELINFISNDRYMTISGGYKKLKWSTPVKEYKKLGEYNLISNASAVWQLEGREFKYAEFDLKSIEYNCSELK